MRKEAGRGKNYHCWPPVCQRVIGAKWSTNMHVGMENPIILFVLQGLPFFYNNIHVNDCITYFFKICFQDLFLDFFGFC